MLLAPERLSASGVGPDEAKFRDAVERANSGLARAGGSVKVALFGAEGKVGLLLGPALERAGHEVRGFEIGDAIDVAGL